jgi:hypothetical protein
LDLSTIPTPKEFKDAIESLSPEQQAFAKAFRSMQLESTLFGILVIQIKPQLEKVLRLPDDSLTKEIKLTQDLMDLFIQYQIPSDLLAFDENNNIQDGALIIGSGPSEKVAAVKNHVAAMYEMINKSKEEEIQSRRMEAEYLRPSPPPGGGGGDMLQSTPFPIPMAVELFEDCVPQMMACEAAPPPSLRRSLSGAMKHASKQMMRSAVAVAGSAIPSSSFTGAKAMPGNVSLEQTSTVTEQTCVEPSLSQQKQQHTGGTEEGAQLESGRDYTQVPKEMDARFESLDVDGQVRPTIITPGSTWTKSSQKALLAKPETTSLDSDAQKKEKDAAFDLLDALTKSGALPVEHASLHVVVAATHCFDKSILETLVQDNVNPIDKVERSTLIMATTVHQQPARSLIKDVQIPHLKDTCPMLFDELS